MKYFLNKEKFKEVVTNVETQSEPDIYFYIMSLASCVIATYGLLSASVAVIIGSMVVAPLMYPILDLAIAIIIKNKSKLITAIKAETSAIISSIILSAIIAYFSSDSIINYEITSRTAPTFNSVIIAFASGIAGTTAVCYRPPSHIVAGVAIAVSIIPPICVAGIELSKGEFNLAIGAMLLFLTNIFAILVAGIIVFKLAGFSN